MVVGVLVGLARTRVILSRCFSPYVTKFVHTNAVCDWNKAVANAEKIVGYPASYLSLRCLLSDEISNVAFNMRKLIKSNHPLLKTAKRLIYDGKNGLQTRGLIVLLLAKAAGVKACSDETESMEGILRNQRSLAEITEIIHTAYLVHRGVVNTAGLDLPCKSELEYGNKLSILAGDYLLASASSALAKLSNPQVVEMISDAIGDITQAEFLISYDGLATRVPPPAMSPADWATFTHLSSASLLASSCKAALTLASHHQQRCDDASAFGESLAFAYQIHCDLQPFLPGTGCEDLSLVSLPVITHLARGDTEMRRMIDADVVTSSHMQIMREVVASDTDTLDMCRDVCVTHASTCEEYLNRFGDSDATSALRDFLKVITKF